MADLEKRLAGLSREQRKLLELRLTKERGDRGPAVNRHDSETPPPPPRTAAAQVAGELELSLFFFSADSSAGGSGKYDLLLAASRAADRLGFAAVWTPERHFQDFGGLYPNPSLLGAALAVATERVEIRAGSVVLPLHSPVRIAEEWSVVDNLSGGRAAVACATGWHPADFVIRPQAWETRREETFRAIPLLRRLWAGEEVEMPGGDGQPVRVHIRPRPVRRELPLWLTTSGNPETWSKAGELGTHVLTSYGSQTPEQLAAKVELYRSARRRAGHDPREGKVSLMLHTYLGESFAETKERVREPLTDYLRTHLAQREGIVDLPAVDGADQDALLPLAFEHYVEKASLIGTPESCAPLLGRLAAAGVDEIACLVDFGLDADAVLGSLEALAELGRRWAPRPAREIAS